MFGVKLCFAKHFLGISRQFEVFQSIDAGRKGCLDDHGAWQERFLASWPPGSPAHASYFRRIAEGPRFRPALALPIAA